MLKQAIESREETTDQPEKMQQRREVGKKLRLMEY